MMKYKTKETDRLNLREVCLSDTHFIHELHSLPATDEFNTLGIPENDLVTHKLVGNWVKDQTEPLRGIYVLAIEIKKTKQFIGLIALVLGKLNFRNAEVWYKIHGDHWNKGYSTEALNEILRFGFKELNLHRIEAGCAIDNIASIRVLEKTGFIREGTKRKNLPIRGNWYDSFSYAILAEEYHLSK